MYLLDFDFSVIFFFFLGGWGGGGLSSVKNFNGCALCVIPDSPD